MDAGFRFFFFEGVVLLTGMNAASNRCRKPSGLPRLGLLDSVAALGTVPARTCPLASLFMDRRRCLSLSRDHTVRLPCSRGWDTGENMGKQQGSRY